MQLKDWLFAEDRGVSPVIGVILMVAITVILAAVIATFVMNMGPDQSTPANANWDFDANDTANYVNVSHSGGSAAAVSEYTIQSGSEEVGLDVGISEDEMTAGDTSRIDWEDNESSFDSNTEFQLIWEDPDSDQTQSVDTFSP